MVMEPGPCHDDDGTISWIEGGKTGAKVAAAVTATATVFSGMKGQAAWQGV